MSTATSTPDAYTVWPGRVVFDLHDEHDPSGRLLRRFDEPALREIASRCAARDARGAWCPLTIGHTVPGAPETHQPESVGYARNWRVGPDPVTGRPALLADFHIRQDRLAEAQTYARVSVELWPKDLIIDPVALLRRTPRLDVPQWVYGREGQSLSKEQGNSPQEGSPQWEYRLTGDNRPVLRYSRESTMPVPAVPGPMNAMPSPGGMGAPPPPGGGGDDMAGKLEQYMRHCASHPHARALQDHYGKAEGAGGLPGAPPMPPLGAEPPMSPPAPPPGPGGPEQFSRDAEIARLQAQLAGLQRENRLNSRRQDIQALADEGIDLNVDEELAELGDLEPARYQRELTRIKNRYARVDAGMVPVLAGPEEGEEAADHSIPYSRGTRTAGRYVANGALTMEGSRAVIHYQKEHPELSFEQAREAFIRQHTGKNGRG